MKAPLLKWLAVVAFLGFTPDGVPAAHAWGGEGHRITGYVAESLLTPTARIRLHRLTDGATLDRVATYMDEHKRDLGLVVRKWHFNNDPVCREVTVESYCRQGNCASRQIERLAVVLRSPSASTDEKRQAVFFLAHLIGDIHQPLHSANNEDEGGNMVAVINERRHGRYRETLHGEWDSGFVKFLLRGKSEEELATELIREGLGRTQEFERGSAEDWLKESNRLARDFAYGQLSNFKCGTPLTTTTITPGYEQEARQIVREQLLKAGVRMAWVFNSALDGAMATSDR